jgi:hypothetical protein
MFLIDCLQINLDEPIKVSELFRRVAPEQALTSGELIELLKADELAQVLNHDEPMEQEDLSASNRS